MKQFVIVADLDRCIGCHGGCQVACKTEHEIALGKSRSTLYTMGPTGKFPDLELYFLPLMCQQCENPTCVEAQDKGRGRGPAGRWAAFSLVRVEGRSHCGFKS